MQRSDFIKEYRLSLARVYPWAGNGMKLDAYIASVRETLSGGNSWHHLGDCVTAAWKAIGGQGKPSLKALRALI